MGLKGKDSVVRKLLEATDRLKGAAAAALYQEGLALDAEAVKRTPVDTGRLRASHYVSPPVQEGSGLTVEVGFGTEYAVYVHEMTGAPMVQDEDGTWQRAHGPAKLIKFRAAGTGAKFLQNAMNDRSAGFLERVQKRIRKNLRSGVTSAVLDPAVPTAPMLDVGPQLGPTRHEFNVIQRRNRRSRVTEKRRARRAARRAARKEARRQARVERSFVRKLKNDARRDAKRARKAASAKVRKEAKRQRRVESAFFKKLKKDARRDAKRARRRRKKR